MADPDLDALLDDTADNYEPPKALPAGEYTLRILSHEFDKSSQKGTPLVRYMLQPTEAGDDVDEDMLAEVDNWQNRKLKAEFFLTERAMFMLGQFLTSACQVDIAGRTWRELVEEPIGMEVVGTVSQMATEDGRVFNPKVENFQPAS
jgi:hypothetical protein